jgi:hypothetical protein
VVEWRHCSSEKTLLFRSCEGTSFSMLEFVSHFEFPTCRFQKQLFPETRDGKLQLYSSQRRWLHLAHGWSRVGGKGTTEFSRKTSFSSKGETIKEDTDKEARSVRCLIAMLCEKFYEFGWATGTGGGVSIRVGGPEEDRPWRVFVAPSGIQKGRQSSCMEGCCCFVLLC